LRIMSGSLSRGLLSNPIYAPRAGRREGETREFDSGNGMLHVTLLHRQYVSIVL